jgi:hypothetical protein
MEEQTLIDRVQEAMSTDDEDREKQSEYLQSIYEESDQKTRNKIDEVLMCLCGWSLKTLINRENE